MELPQLLSLYFRIPTALEMLDSVFHTDESCIPSYGACPHSVFIPLVLPLAILKSPVHEKQYTGPYYPREDSLLSGPPKPAHAARVWTSGNIAKLSTENGQNIF